MAEPGCHLRAAGSRRPALAFSISAIAADDTGNTEAMSDSNHDDTDDEMNATATNVEHRSGGEHGTNDDDRAWPDDDFAGELQPDPFNPTLPLEASVADAVDQRLEVIVDEDELR
jgi:hypothetical protein